jgi:predicted RNase H-like HicB family nuclease
VFTVVIEQDEDGIYIASVPELSGCHTQAETLDELNRRIKEAIELYIEVEAEKGEKGIWISSEYSKLKLRFE